MGRVGEEGGVPASGFCRERPSGEPKEAPQEKDGLGEMGGGGRQAGRAVHLSGHSQRDCGLGGLLREPTEASSPVTGAEPAPSFSHCPPFPVRARPRGVWCILYSRWCSLHWESLGEPRWPFKSVRGNLSGRQEAGPSWAGEGPTPVAPHTSPHPPMALSRKEQKSIIHSEGLGVQGSAGVT